MALAQSATPLPVDLDEDRHSWERSQVDFTYGRPNHALKGSQSLLRPVKDKVRSEVKGRKLRLEEFFQPFDFHNNKKVSEAAFLRAMDASGINLTSSELKLLMDRYRVPGASDSIDYQRFCDQSNKVFTCKGLERAPGKKAEMSYGTIPTVLGAENPTLTPLEKARTVEMLEEVRRNVRDNGIIIKDLFKQFDPNANGCVSGDQFLSVVGCHGLLSAGKVLNMENNGHILVKAFTQRADGPGLEAVLVSYKALHDQTLASERWSNRVAEGKPALLFDGCPEEYYFLSRVESEGERLERLLVEEAVARHIEVLDYFYTEEGGHVASTKHQGTTFTSSCSRERFKQLLRGLWKTHFTDEQVDALADRFKPLDNRPSIKRSSNTVDLAAFTRHILKRILVEKEKAAAEVKGGKTRPSGRSAVVHPRLSTSEAEDVRNVVSEIRAKIRRERISLKPSFKSFDPGNELVVAAEQFCRVLSPLGLLPFDARLRELLTRRYTVSDFRRQTTIHQGFVAYLEFLEDVDAPLTTDADNFVLGRNKSLESERKSEAATTLSRVGGKALSANLRSAASLTSEALMGRVGIGRNPTRDCDAVIRDIKRRTMGERVRIMDLFQDFDHFQHGTCTQAQLARVMKTLDHALTDTELAAVCNRYQKKTIYEFSSGDGTPLIDYKRLVSDIEAVFTVKDLERKPTTTVVGEELRKASGIERRLRGESSRVEQLTPEEEKMLETFIRELAMKVTKDSLNLSPLFAEFDRFNIGDVTEAGMERALGGARLQPPEPVFRALVKKFREHSRNNLGGEVNYKAFIAAVELAQDPLRPPRDLPNATRFRALRADGGADNVHDKRYPSASPGDDEMMTTRARDETLRSALLSIREHLSHNHCQLKDFFVQEDTLKTGEVSCTAMRHCLVLAGVRLTSPELLALDKAFRSHTRPETIGWQDLCRAAFGPNRGKLGNASDQSPSGRSSSEWKEEEVLLKIGGEIKMTNPNLELTPSLKNSRQDLFKSYDRSNRGLVTEANFFSVLSQGLPRIHLTPEDEAILARMLVNRTGYDFGGEVRYKRFLAAVRC